MLGNLQFGEHKRKGIFLKLFTMYYKYPHSKGGKEKTKRSFQ